MKSLKALHKEFEEIKIRYGIEPRSGCEYPAIDEYKKAVKAFITKSFEAGRESGWFEAIDTAESNLVSYMPPGKFKKEMAIAVINELKIHDIKCPLGKQGHCYCKQKAKP